MVSYGFKKVTVIRIARPQKKDVNKDLQWFSESLGLFSERDKERSCFRIFIELVKAARRGQIYTSDEIAYRTNLSRGTVVFHLNKLIEAGLISYENGRYILRVSNLEELVKEVRKDLSRVFDELQVMAQELDDELGLIKRGTDNSKTIVD